MNCRALLCISILVLCTTTSAAPSSGLEWLKAANKTEFDRYRATLLSPAVMPFLSTCYDPKCCEENTNRVCSLYFETISWAKEANFDVNVTKDLVAKIPTPSVEEFCTSLLAMRDNITNGLGHKFSALVTNMDQTACIIICGSVETKKARESCGAWSWLLGAVANFQAAQAKVIQDKQVEVSQPKSENAAVESQSGNVEAEAPLVPVLSSKGKVHIVQVPQDPLPDKEEASPIKSDPETNTIQKAEPAPKEEVVPPKSSNTTVAGTAKSEEPSVVSTKPKPTAASTPEAENEMKPPVEVPSTSNKTTTESTPIAASQDMDKKGLPQDIYDDAAEQGDESSEPDNSLLKLESSDIGLTQKEVPQMQPDSREQDIVIEDQFKEEPSSNFFYYFLFGMFACILAYVVYNNKSKILALILEGRRSQNGRGGRRKHTAAYRKLDSNLEEAIMSAPSGRTSQIIY